MGVFDELKSVGKVLQEAGKIEQYQQILDAQQKMLEMQKKVADLEQENRGLKERLNLKEQLVHRAEVYYIKKANSEEGPFCAKCFDVDEKLVHMTQWNEKCKKCPNCDKVFQIM